MFPRIKTTLGIALGVILAATALVGCSTPAPTASSSSTTSVRSAGVKGVRICIKNETDEIARIDWLRSDKRDALEKNILRVGKTTCADGYQTSLLENDVTARVTWPDRLSQVFTAWNQFAGRPQVRVDAAKQSAADACGFSMSGPMDQDVGIAVVCSDGYSETETRMYTAYDYHQTVLQRVNDSADNKEFVMTLKK